MLEAAVGAWWRLRVQRDEKTAVIAACSLQSEERAQVGRYCWKSPQVPKHRSSSNVAFVEYTQLWKQDRKTVDPEDWSKLAVTKARFVWLIVEVPSSSEKGSRVHSL